MSARKPQRCRTCYRVGHNRRTCERRPDHDEAMRLVFAMRKQIFASNALLHRLSRNP